MSHRTDPWTHRHADMSAELPADFAEPVRNFEASLATIEAQVRRLQAAPWAELCKGLPPLEVARVHLMVAYAVSTLFYMYLKTQGLSPASHPVREELERVKVRRRQLPTASDPPLLSI